MMRRLVSFQFGKRWGRALLWALPMALVQVAALLLFDEGSIQQLAQLRAELPWPTALLGIGSSATLSAHLASYGYAFLLPLLGFAFASSLAAQLVAGQVETGEMAYYLALPLHRRAMPLIAALTGGALLLCSLLAQMGLAALGALLLHPGRLDAVHFLLMNLGLYLQLLLALAIGLIPACAQDEMRPARRQGRALIALLWLVSLLPRLRHMPAPVKYLAPFSWVDQGALSAGRLSPELLILPAIALLCLAMAAMDFSRRDLAL